MSGLCVEGCRKDRMVGWNGIVRRGLFTWDGYSMAFWALMRFLPYEDNTGTILQTTLRKGVIL